MGLIEEYKNSNFKSLSYGKVQYRRWIELGKGINPNNYIFEAPTVVILKL